MSVLFAGGELSSFTPSDTTNVTEATAGRDATYSRTAIQISNISAYIEAGFTSQPSVWFHGELTIAASTSGGTFATFYTSGGTAVFRWFASAANTAQMQYWNGSAWTNIGSTFTWSASSRYSVDLFVSATTAQLYIGGTLVASGSASMTAITSIAKLRLGNSGNVSYWSQVIVADESTVGWKLATLAPSANGANTDWSGDYTAIDDPTSLDDADLISSGTADQVETFTATDATTATSLQVKAVVVSARARLNGAGPGNLQMAVRSAGSNYFSGNVSGLGVGFAPVQAVFGVDPATSSAWSLANANSAEIGVKSVA